MSTLLIGSYGYSTLAIGEWSAADFAVSIVAGLMERFVPNRVRVFRIRSMSVLCAIQDSERRRDMKRQLKH